MGMSEQLSMMPTPTNEEERRRVLRKHKIAVTSLLGLMAVVFLSCSWAQSQGDDAAWIGYVRAAAEAGMVGGLADWFAVTALFTYPMGIPIPHTAIIPNKKDQVAGVLSDFVSENFLNARTITDKVMAAGIPERVGRWLAKPETRSGSARRPASSLSAWWRALTRLRRRRSLTPSSLTAWPSRSGARRWAAHWRG